jgi:hypothetical protein
MPRHSLSHHFIAFATSPHLEIKICPKIGAIERFHAGFFEISENFFPSLA